MSEIRQAGTMTSERADSGEVVEATGATIEEAVSAALGRLGVSRDQVEVEVLASGARPVPGERLSGSEARVRVQRIDAYAAKARGLAEELLTRMEVPCRVSVRRAAAVRDGGPPPVILDISGDDLGLLIGWRGETLRALQTTLNLMMGEEGIDGRRIILDVERYRARREEQVRELALRLAMRVKRSGERFTLDPMHAYERRVIHLTLADDESVTTESTGREPARRVVILPTGPAQGGPLPPMHRPARPGPRYDRHR